MGWFKGRVEISGRVKLERERGGDPKIYALPHGSFVAAVPCVLDIRDLDLPDQLAPTSGLGIWNPDPGSGSGTWALGA